MISPRLMYDGRPVLWQNLDSDSSAVFVKFFSGERYNFFGLINGQDTSGVYAGLNTAGFAIVFSSLKESSPDSAQHREPLLLKQALSLCGRLEDFERLLDSTSVSIGANTSFACMDAFGAQQLYESGKKARVPFDLKTSPDGFLVRANFHFADPQTANDSFWRYHRAKALLAKQRGEKKLHHHTIVKSIARDLTTMASNPYPLPDQRNSGYHRCDNSINQYNSVSCVVIHGVRPGESPDFSTLWMIPGEPICGIAVPLWPATTQVPIECQRNPGSLNSLYMEIERELYNQTGSLKQLDTRNYLEIKSRLNEVENKVFAETRKALARWRNQDDYLQDMTAFQASTAAFIYNSLK